MKNLFLISMKCCMLLFAFFIFSSEECKEKTGAEHPAKTEQQENPQQPETSIPPEGYQPPIADTSKTVTPDKDCIEKSEEQQKIPCPDVYDPVCGCDGKNYPNPCEAKRAGVKNWEKGRCE